MTGAEVQLFSGGLGENTVSLSLRGGVLVIYAADAQWEQGSADLTADEADGLADALRLGAAQLRAAQASITR